MPSANSFNEQCYLQRYPDLSTRENKEALARSGMPLSEQYGWMFMSADGTWHYGRTSGRKLKRISDDAYWHWLNFGQAEGRVSGCDLLPVHYSETFDPNAYVARYPDVSGRANWYNPFKSDPLQHYNMIGKAQGRIPGYEILFEDSPVGITSPGTTRFETRQTAADNEKKFTSENTSSGTGVNVSDNTGIGKTALIIGGAAVAIYFFINRKKKK